jgi:predicted flap endonuclease-1-like 5' DNA nuclease
MATNLLWFVMAGFLLGFAASTLWEWFYFRRERLKLTDRRIRELEAKIRDAEAEPDTLLSSTDLPISSIPTVTSVTGSAPRTSAWGESSYRSPGVFLESEEYGGESGERARELPADAPPVIPTVNSIAPVPSTPAHPPESAFAPRAEGAATDLARREAEQGDSARAELPTPADALRAKRSGGPRSRQELLATLRRNSEAMQRGQFPAPEGEKEEVPRPVLPRSGTLVSPTAHSEPPPGSDTPSAAPPTPALSPVRLRWVNNPELTQRSKEYPDDLSKIKGIGDVYKQRLYRAGIYTWKQIAEADTETLRRATSAYPSSNVEEWLVQAQKLMEKHGRKDAVYGGPQPDDMTRILGIGPVGASVLYRAGICTYEQLATTSVAELEALFPVAVAGDLPDFGQWVARATALADEKHGG